MLQYINGDIFVLAVQVGLKSSLSLLGLCFCILLLYFFIGRIFKNIASCFLLSKKTIFRYAETMNEKYSTFFKKIIHISFGLFIIFFAWTITSLIINLIAGWVLDHQTFAKSTLEELKNINFTSAQKEWVQKLYHFLTYSGLAFVILLVPAGFFIMLGSVASFFQKVAYFLLTIFILCCFSLVIWWTYFNLFDKVLELKAETVPIQQTK